MGLYTKVPVAECYDKIGGALLPVCCININNGDRSSPNYRSRAVSRGICIHKRDDLFVWIQPLEALKSVLSLTASGNRGQVVMVDDVSRAFFHAKVRREAYVQTAAEDVQPGGDGQCGQLIYPMHGARDAAQNLANECVEMLMPIGLEQGEASPRVFPHRERPIRIVVHGGGCVSAATSAQLRWLNIKLESECQIKTRWLGPGQEHQQKSKD